MKKLSSSEIKELELQILIKFDHFCEENHLKYNLTGGTLLGAVRHKGFIPWDDDIDVCMPRPDYEQLLKIWNDECGRYLLRCKGSDGTPSLFSKIIDTNTLIKSTYVNSNMDEALWIDIFPVDGLPEDIKEVERIYKKSNFYRKLYVLSDAKLGQGRSKIRMLSKFILKPVALVLGKKFLVEKLLELAGMYNYEEMKYVGAITWGLYGLGERMLKKEYESSVKLEFEGRSFNTYSCWDGYLKAVYGDYMKLPPEEKRINHAMEAYLK